ncbi:hypothetical protein I5693_15750 [Burkholderia cenocepacia]|uniref:hypothetical protein n=1 Tax=Burkholderia cepacia complex TaxID=87882 RepID=UPI0013DF2329|nr:hypothetical protein [Burkholderia cenocepacia]MBJ9669002.1 hypothetical protein [Burkholderia cenocepacia]MCW3581608.1 hypothetical protein [Burkholderia cenocepacia]MCW3626818.1 hypothetical protein [Burkholderia cenocepacia]MCW5178953.1 hypothetical protein [Burkholderia cenocepacia]NGO96253.1 hypothetical protein [Burkholderia cenocepacia]
MKSEFKIQRPDDVPMVLTMTMTLGEWKKLETQLAATYPSWKLSTSIGAMVRLATTTFAETKELDL